MIGEVMVGVALMKKGDIPFSIGVRYPCGRGEPFLAFDMENEKTLKAIQEKDPIIFDILQSTIDIARRAPEYESALCEMDNGKSLGVEYYVGHFEEYKKSLNNLMDNPFANDEDKTEANRQLREIAKYEEQELRKHKTMSVKKELIKKRRCQFQQQRHALFLTLIERDGYECAECKSQDNLEIDHISPLSKGGTDELKNLRFLCQPCNRKKSDKLPG